MLPPLILQNVRFFSTKKRKLLGVYSSLPCDLFRVNSTEKVILRDLVSQTENGLTSFDVVLDSNGLVQPSAGNLFIRPNGMSVRPNGLFLQEIIGNFRSFNTTIYKLPKGLELKSHQLTLLWEHNDHHSVQTTVPIELDALNDKLTKLCVKYGEKMNKSEFMKKYPLSELF